MRRLQFANLTRLIFFTCVLALLPLVVVAQTTTTNSTGGSTQTTQTTRTTETSQQPTSVQVSRTTTTIDPLWLGVGALVLLAILAILIMSMRGRTTDNTSVVHERETVVRRE
jgi:beta-lactamase regulating signal transducer with metallopeptidase domain